MDILTTLQAQLLDPFRIVLLIGLAITMGNTRAVTGTVVPALAGIVFVAVLIPMTMAPDLPFWPQVLVGLPANAILLGIILAVREAANRLLR